MSPAAKAQAKAQPKAVKDFPGAFSALTHLLAAHAGTFQVTANTTERFTLMTRRPSPFPQHKGQPLWFAEVRMGRAYVSLHLMGLYMNDTLTAGIAPELKKRMQGKTCFNFSAPPTNALAAEIARLIAACTALYAERDWL